jgi:hypothetical protein
MPDRFESFFRTAVGDIPYAYQAKMAATGLPDHLEVPTGAGKSAAAVLPWLYRRLVAAPDRTPRRLVYVLPQHSLVQQPYARIGEWLERLGCADEVGLYLGSGSRRGRLAASRRHRPPPGAVLLLDASRGGYLPDQGWAPSSRTPVTPVLATEDDEPEISCIAWVSLDQHLMETEDEARIILDALPPLPAAHQEAVTRAARYHDLGKCHDVFQDMLRQGGGDPPDGQLAKVQGPLPHRTLESAVLPTRTGQRTDIAARRPLALRRAGPRTGHLPGRRASRPGAHHRAAGAGRGAAAVLGRPG